MTTSLHYVHWTPAQMRREARAAAMVVGASASALAAGIEQLGVTYGIRIEAITFAAVAAIAFTLPALACYVLIRLGQAKAVANYDPAHDLANMRFGSDKQQPHN
ncbi:hypothetical protein [Burkholderia gladioli]|uniref:hypothetical protein n=1 Tax=Burkholderia gladioli TaxID=28095 RepID=UPI00163F207F|nr:hypothetical protein [Burkholderia gladioli]